MDLTEALRTTGAVREFTDEPVDDATVHRLLDTARFAPNGGQPPGLAGRRGEGPVGATGPAATSTCRDGTSTWPRSSAGLTPWAVVTDRELERRAVAERRRDRRRRAPRARADSPSTSTRSRCCSCCWPTSARLATVDRDLDHYTMVGGASIYPFAWSILLAARDRGSGRGDDHHGGPRGASGEGAPRGARHARRGRDAGPRPSGPPAHPSCDAARSRSSPPSTASTAPILAAGEGADRRRHRAHSTATRRAGRAGRRSRGARLRLAVAPRGADRPHPRPAGRAGLCRRPQSPAQAGDDPAAARAQRGPGGQAAGHARPAVGRAACW